MPESGLARVSSSFIFILETRRWSPASRNKATEPPLPGRPEPPSPGLFTRSVAPLGSRPHAPGVTLDPGALLVGQDGVILGADTRATDDMVVADKNCLKIHYVAPRI